MSRRRIGTSLTVAAAVAFIATAGLHATGYDSVTALAEQAAGDLASLVPMLWLGFSVDLVVLGLVIGAVALRGAGGRLILTFTALCPLAAAGLQVRFLGFIAPTAILLAVTVLTLAAAAVRPPERASREAR
jgi:hypothetical protein